MSKKYKSKDIFEKLKIQEQLVSTPIYYLHYDPLTKNIVNLRNYLEKIDSNPYIEITEKDLDVSLSQFDISKYKVVLDKNSGKKLERISSKVTFATIDDFIYEIPKINSDHRITAKDRSFDLLIEQNNIDNVFRIKLARELREKYSDNNNNLQYITVYVTESSDPNILYKTLKFTFGDLIQNEFYTIEYEDFKGNDVNIYAFKYFENYLHVDIR